MESKHILIAYTDAGGGHRATALTIKHVLEKNTPHRVTLINPYKELIADIDLFARLTPYSDEEVYNRFILGRGWNTLFCLAYYGATLANIHLGSPKSEPRVIRYMEEQEIDLVISVMPMSNQGFYRCAQTLSSKGPVPFIVVMTDFMETMKYTWFPKQQDYYLVCGTPEAHAKAVSKPHPPSMAFNAGGLVVHPKFYETQMTDRQAECETLGLDPSLPTGCVMYGGTGSVRMAQIAKMFSDISQKVQLIFLCGKNKALADSLEAMDLPYPHLVRTFTQRMPYYFAVSDFWVGKPGPGSISEALVTGILPVVDAGRVLPQERYNLTWLKKNGYGHTFKRVRELGELVQHFDISKIRQHRNPIGTGNRAVFELPGIVEKVLTDCCNK